MRKSYTSLHKINFSRMFLPRMKREFQESRQDRSIEFHSSRTISPTVELVSDFRYEKINKKFSTNENKRKLWNYRFVLFLRCVVLL